MECWVPAFPEQIPDTIFKTGVLSIHIDGENDAWKSNFSYYPNAQVIPFENDDSILLLKPGEDEVSLHVCSHTHVQFFLLCHLFGCLYKNVRNSSCILHKTTITTCVLIFKPFFNL